MESEKTILAGKYLVEKLIHQDATGKLYQGVHSQTKREVWLKVYSPELARDRERLANLAALLQSLVAAGCEHFVQILDLELPRDAKEPAVLVMEWVRGESLDMRLERVGRLTVMETCRLASQLLFAMEACHTAQVAPLRLEGSQIFLTQYAGQKDFVKIRGAISPQPDLQAGIAADLVVLGEILFFSLMGQKPPKSKDAAEMEKAVLEGECMDDSPPSGLQEAARICARCLAGGYSSVKEVTEELKAAGLIPDAFGEGSVSLNVSAITPMISMEPERIGFVTDPTMKAKLPTEEEGEYETQRQGTGPFAVEGNLPRTVEQPPAGSAATAAADSEGTGRSSRYERRSVRLFTVLASGAAGTLLGILLTLSFLGFLGRLRKSTSAARSTKGAKKKEKDRSVVPPFSGRRLSFAVAYYFTDPETRREMEALCGYLSLRLGMRVEIAEVPYDRVAGLLEEGKIDLAVFTPYLYVLERKKRKDFLLLATHLAEGALTYDGYIVVQEQSQVRNLRDLEGKRFCFVSRKSTSGFLFAAARLKSSGLRLEKAVKNAVFSGTHSAAIDDLVAGRCDAAAVGAYYYVDSMINRGANLRILAVTERIPGDAYCASPLLAPGMIDRIKKALTEFDPMRELKRKFLGSTHRASGFVLVSDRHYDPIRRVDALLGPSMRPK